MLQMEQFLRDDVFPSWFANALTKALSVMTSQFQLVRLDATHIQLGAGADAAAAMLSIGGLWRWVEAPITLAHPGGAAATYPTFATARNNDITASPAPFTDATDYSFQLVIDAPGAVPVINPGVVDVYRHVADVVWDGAQIVRVDQLAPPSPQHAGRHAAGGPDPVTPAMIAATPSGDSSVYQPGDFIVSGANSRIGAVLCDGRAYARADSTYAALFAKIGTRYGAGDGSTTFNVPDAQGRGLIGVGAGAGLTARTVGDKGGVETVTLSAAQIPPHSHPSDPAVQGGGSGTPDDGGGASLLTSSGPAFASIHGLIIGNVANNTGGGGSHSNMAPYLAVNVFIKL